MVFCSWEIRGGSVKRLTLFAKGNADIRDSLHFCRVAGTLRWNGINEALKTSHPDTIVRVRHETCTRSDAVLAAEGTIPASLQARNLMLGAYPAPSQFSTALFDTPVDAVVLSLQPEISTGLFRHRGDGYLFYASDLFSWAEADRAWLRAEFEPLGLLSVDAAMRNLAALVERIRAIRDVPILIYNLSPYIPGEIVHCHQGFDETFATRIRRFNLGLVELSERTGISIVDVETVLARHGAERLKIDAMHLTGEGYELVAREVVRICDDLGLLDQERIVDAA
jgi:hypothetical protein